MYKLQLESYGSVSNMRCIQLHESYLIFFPVFNPLIKVIPKMLYSNRSKGKVIGNAVRTILLILAALVSANDAVGREHADVTLSGLSFSALKDAVDNKYGYVLFPALYGQKLRQPLGKKGISADVALGLQDVDRTLKVAIQEAAKANNVAFDAYDVAEIGLMTFKSIGVVDKVNNLADLINYAIITPEKELRGVDHAARSAKYAVLNQKIANLVREVNEPFRQNSTIIVNQLVEFVTKNKGYYATPNIEKLDIKGFKLGAPLSEVSQKVQKNTLERETLAKDAAISDMRRRGEMSGAGFFPSSSKGPSISKGSGGALVEDGGLSLYYTCSSSPVVV